MARKQTAHEKFVATLGCAVCGRAAQVHHLLRVAGRHMMGKRAPEQFCIGLCPEHHFQLHEGGSEETFTATHKLNGEWLAGVLWGIYGTHIAEHSWDQADRTDEALEAIALSRYGR